MNRITLPIIAAALALAACASPQKIRQSPPAATWEEPQEYTALYRRLAERQRSCKIQLLISTEADLFPDVKRGSILLKNGAQTLSIIDIEGIAEGRSRITLYSNTGGPSAAQWLEQRTHRWIAEEGC
jgi:hypothetical protein